MSTQNTASSPREPFGAGLQMKPVGAGDVVSLNRHLFSEASLDRAEADALFDLERAALTRSEAWTTFFVEAITDHVVWGARPTGRIDEDQAAWLLDQADRTRTPASLALLVNVLDEAQSHPSWLATAVRSRAAAGWPGVVHGAEGFSRPLPRAA